MDSGSTTGRRTGRRRTALAGLAACAAVLVAGCGSGGDEQAAAGTTAQAAASSSPADDADTPASATPDTTPAGADAGAVPGDGRGGAGGAEGSERCHTSELRGSVVGGEGAAGTTYRTLVLTNTGERTCYVRGFPGVSYVGGDDGHQIGPAAAMSGERGAAVRLGPGGSTGATLGLTDVRNLDPATCRPEPARGLRVYPPGETDSLFVPTEGTGCSGGTGQSDQLSVESFRTR